MAGQTQDNGFGTSQEIIVFYRHQSLRGDEWAWRQEDLGPGYFFPEPGFDVGVRARYFDDDDLQTMVGELQACQVLTFLDLSENRKLTNDGLFVLKHLPGLQELNLSDCQINHHALVHLIKLPHLNWLDVSYCKGIADRGVAHFNQMGALTFLNIRGCSKITQAGYKQLQRPGLEIKR